jgi:L-lysine exporter family protein LysE/ArgO
MASASILQSALTGFLIGLGLIVAIGAQNAYVLRQGLLRRHVLAITTVCALSDALLILAGVAGLGTWVQSSPALLAVATLSGALFLAIYGGLAARRALRPGVLVAASDAGSRDLAPALAATLGFTFLNPHVYLDTVVLVGSLSAQFRDAAKAAYALGAMSASAVWFYALGFGARLLAPIFARPAAWRALDGLIALVMWTIAVNLVLGWWSGPA